VTKTAPGCVYTDQFRTLSATLPEVELPVNIPCVNHPRWRALSTRYSAEKVKADLRDEMRTQRCYHNKLLGHYTDLKPENGAGPIRQLVLQDPRSSKEPQRHSDAELESSGRRSGNQNPQ
jgi:hypothetical protein